MPTADILAVINGVTTGFEIIGAGVMVLSLVSAGLCLMVSWVDQHIGPFVKRVFTSVLAGGALIGGAGALGQWFVSTLHLTGGATTVAVPAAMVMFALSGWLW